MGIAELRRPRLLYIRDSLRCGFFRLFHFLAQWATLLLVGVGGTIAVVLLGLRIAKLFGLLATYGGGWSLPI